MKAWNAVLTILVAVLLMGYMNLYCNEMEIDGNSAGVLISALAVAVTFLIGWQIVNAIEVNQTLKKSQKEAELKFEQLAANLEEKIKNVQLEQEATMFFNFGWSAIKNENVHERSLLGRIIVSIMRLYVILQRAASSIDWNCVLFKCRCVLR